MQGKRVVISLAGRDKGYWMVILEILGDYAIVVDGKERPISRPKRKRLIHIKETGYTLPDDMFTGDRKLRKALADLKASSQKEELYLGKR